MKLYKRNRLVAGVGVNDANYNVYERAIVNGKQKRVWTCPFYRAWRDMLVRCYSEREQARNPTYKGCSSCDEWLIFSQFKVWMESQDWEGKALDKDLLIEGNKIYSPDTCIFVPQLVNTFTLDSGTIRGDYMIGVYWHKGAGKFLSRCSNPFTGKQEYLGLFTNELEAHLAWKTRKHELACLLADSEYVSDPRLTEVLKTKYMENK